MKGVEFPLKRHAEGYWRIVSDLDLLKSDLTSLLYIIPGEVPMYPTLGNPLYKLLFELNNDILTQIAEDLTEITIKRYEPRVDIIDIRAIGDGNELRVILHLIDKTTGTEFTSEVSYELQR